MRGTASRSVARAEQVHVHEERARGDDRRHRAARPAAGATDPVGARERNGRDARGERRRGDRGRLAGDDLAGRARALERRAPGDDRDGVDLLDLVRGGIEAGVVGCGMLHRGDHTPAADRAPLAGPTGRGSAGGGRREGALVDAIALDDPAVHRLHAAVHRPVRLEDPPHLAPLDRRARRNVEVLDVQRGGDAGVLVLGLDAEEADPHAVDDLLAPQVVPPAERQDPAVHAPQDLVDVRDRDRDRDRLLAALGDHEPIAVVHERQLLGEHVEVGLGVRLEVPVLAPGRVVDVGEALELLAEAQERHLAQRDAVLRAELLRELEEDRAHLLAVGDLELPHEEIHRLRHAGLLQPAGVVRRMPRLLDERLALEALDEHARLVVHREVHRADHAVARAPPQPRRGRLEQGGEDRRVVLELEEAEHAPRVVVGGVERVVDLGADPPHDAARAAGDEQARVAMREERVLAAAEERVALQTQRGDPLWRGRVQPERKLDELAQVGPRPHGVHVHGHGGAPYMAGTQIDVFAKVRGHERAEQLRAAREADVLPYFRLVEGPARPVVEMEGAERIMLGSNNYLGLTGDERVIAGAREALERFGTGLTGSRLLNGTTPLHLELERELAEWMGTDDAIVFTTGHQANVGTLGTILAPGDTVVADSGAHASTPDGCLLSRAKLRPYRHNRMDKLERTLEKASRDSGGILVVVDGVFSMEGDVAPLQAVCDLCERFGARLMVDEAHAAGVLGARGAGTAELMGVENRVDLRMGTFSKSLASCGGFVAGSAEVIEFLRIQSRAFLFTASSVPAAAGAALAALRVIRSGDGRPLMDAVLENARYLRDGLEERGFAVVAAQPLPGGGDVVTPIVPVLVGDDWKAVFLWRALYDAGVFVNTALHPAVPPGGALLRTSVMATHDRATLDRALDAFASVKGSFEAEHGALPGPGGH